MSSKPVAPCFECTARGGRLVRLTPDRFDHILGRHPELGTDFAYLKPEIMKALELAESVTDDKFQPEMEIYVGPQVVPNGVSAGLGRTLNVRRFRVVVRKEASNRGRVVTAYTIT